jgi:phosphatidylglycerol:prolipoprotein diacylglycerol transferase
MSLPLFIHWNIDPNIPLPFDFFTVQWYGFMWSISIISCFYVGKWILRKEDLPEDHLVLIIQYIFIGAIIGARLGQVFFYQWDYFSQNPIEIFKIWNGGLASHGGVIGGAVGLFLFLRKYPVYKLIWLADRASLVIFIPAALIRLGNLFNSELYGKATDVPWAFIFERVDTVPRHPVVLYEAIAYFSLFFIGVKLYNHFRDSLNGFYVAYFFASTFFVRFCLEFFKEAEGHLYVGIISKTQLLSLPFIVLGVGIAIYSFQKKQVHELS